MTTRLPFVAGLTGAAMLALLTTPVWAQEAPGSLIGPPAPPVGALLAPPDTLVAAPAGADSVAPASLVGPVLPTVLTAPAPAPDSVVQNRNRRITTRLKGLEKQIPLVYNPYVRGFLDYFTVRNPKYTRRMLERQNLYFPLFERTLARYGMPEELKYLSVVESALNPRAASHALAVGLWQFIPEAAKDYRLVINSWKDERMDPEKATDAACRYLRNLNRAFHGDWELTLAAYNCGPGNVRKAIRRAGGRANFWSIFPYLPQETRGYVPSFTAVVYAMNYAHEYGIVAENLQFPVTTDTVMVNGPLDVAKLSVTLGLEAKAIHDLNPELRRPLLPALPSSYALKIPADKRLAFDALNRVEVLAMCRPQQPVALARDSARSADRPRYVSSRYVVRRGESLQRVAMKNGCTVAQLRKWNRLRSTTLRSGQGLVVWKAVKPAPVVVEPTSTAIAATPSKPDSGSVATTSATTSATPQQPEALSSEQPAGHGVATLTPAQLDSIRANGYTVRQGDNLFKIGRTFNIPVRKLAEWNGLENQQVMLGQSLVLRAPAAEEATASSSEPVVLPGGELAGEAFVKAPEPRKGRAAAATTARTRWSAAARQRARVVHMVQPGDTLWDISRKRNVSVDQIRRLNGLKSDALKPGQKIVISQG